MYHPGPDGLIIQIHALLAIIKAESMELIQVIVVSFDSMLGIPLLSLQVYDKVIYPGHGQFFKSCQNPGTLLFFLLQLLNIDGLKLLLTLCN